jgi:hypothetical protein
VKLHSGLPKGCPPQEAAPVDGDIFIGVRQLPLSDQNFRSQNENGHKDADPNTCQRWGLSCWRSLDAAKSAQKLFWFMKNWHIACGRVDSNDGFILATPNPKNPKHHTWWINQDENFSTRFSIVSAPVEQ